MSECHSHGEIKNIYKADFPQRSKVRIANRSFLEYFFRTWKLHHELAPDQLDYAGLTAEAKSVGFYHGGDQLYTLKGIPGIWHERCLEAAP
jgi:hypothetical protein